MILYTLACDSGHRFESWFRDSVAYDDQSARGFLVCPACRSMRVGKAIMAPAVVNRAAAPSLPAAAPNAGTEAVPEETAAPDVALLDDSARDFRSMIKTLRDKLVAEGHDVGSQFADEARRMHDGETPKRQIYGQASPEEARDLLDEGIMVLPMPVVPDELN